MREVMMSTGEVAEKMHVSVRALQYYDRIGLLAPSARSAGGRRRYSGQDMVKLHQILSLKYLGFTLEEIRARLTGLQTPEEVLAALEAQREAVQAERARLDEALAAIARLQQEIRDMAQVDWEKYAAIITLLRMENEAFWVVKCLGKKLLHHVAEHIGQVQSEEIYYLWQQLCDEADALVAEGCAPEDARAQALAARWWDMVMRFTGGDMSMLGELVAFDQDKSAWDAACREKQQRIDDFIGQALGVYIASQGIDVPELG
nr:MerR family transcriptional regulator [Maliibacterium massiliense]